MIKKALVAVFGAAVLMIGSAFAASPDDLHALGCRIVSRNAGSVPEIMPIADTSLDTLSSDAADRTFDAVLHDGRRLAVSVQHVTVRLPGDRFNVAMKLDGKTHIRMNHLDLDIYIETVIDERTYVVHCFRETRSMQETQR